MKTINIAGSIWDLQQHSRQVGVTVASSLCLCKVWWYADGHVQELKRHRVCHYKYNIQGQQRLVMVAGVDGVV